MNIVSRIAAFGIIVSFAIAPALAQTIPTAPTAPVVTRPAVQTPTMPAKPVLAKPEIAKPVMAKPEAAKTTKAQRTAKSMECSKDADTKKFHGKARKKFMSDCKKA